MMMTDCVASADLRSSQVRCAMISPYRFYAVRRRLAEVFEDARGAVMRCGGGCRLRRRAFGGNSIVPLGSPLAEGSPGP